MKKLSVFIFIAALLLSCKKEEKINISGCAVEMKQKFDNELKCTKENQMATNLYIGIYKGNTVYFPMLMCPACNSIPPAFGYTCTNKKIPFEKFNDVTEIKIVYDSCTKKFSE